MKTADIFRYILLFVICLLWNATFGQQKKCGGGEIKAMLKSIDTLNSYVEPQYKISSQAILYPIPVIFHIVLTQAQIDKIGGVEGIEQRINDQMTIINNDFNRSNSDSNLISPNFKLLYGNVNIKFALAKMALDGSYSKGYELSVIANNGIELNNGEGSGFAFSDAKNSQSGGLEAWDPSSYLNVWVINPFNNGEESSYTGYTLPLLLAQNNLIPYEEAGIILNYRAFGLKMSPSQYYISSATQGRTLTHELGHFFGLYHIWGDDNGLCPSNGGSDDEIADTPPQSNAVFGCPSYPKFDNCTSSGSGIMFNNYMDYTNDECQNMFTIEQSSKMFRKVLPDGSYFPLTQHLGLSEVLNQSGNDFVITPNPSSGIVYILFEKVEHRLKDITIYDVTGKKVGNIITHMPSASYSFDFSSQASGFYFVRMHFSDNITITRALLKK